MRIVVDTLSSRLVTGLGVYTRNTINVLTSCFPSADWVLVGDSVSLESISTLSGVNVNYVDLGGLKFGENSYYPPIPERFKWRHMVGQYLSENEADIYYSPTYFLPVAENLPPMVSTVHDVLFRTFPDQYPKPVRDFYNLVTVDACIRAQFIICISEVTRGELLTYYPARPERSVVVHNGVSSEFKPSPQTDVLRVRKQYALPSSYLLSIISGNSPRKNVKNIVQAHSILKNILGDESPSLVIISQALYETREFVESIPDEVYIIPYARQKDLPAIISGAQALVFPSLSEGFGLPVLEAMGCGTPVVASDIPIFREISEGSATLVDPNDPSNIAQGILEARSRHLVSAGIKRAEQMSWENTANGIMSVFSKITENR